jgi:hypothetical protein
VVERGLEMVLWVKLNIADMNTQMGANLVKAQMSV